MNGRRVVSSTSIGEATIMVLFDTFYLAVTGFISQDKLNSFILLYYKMN